MSVLRSLLGGKSEQKASADVTSLLFGLLLGQGESKSGSTVNVQTALGVADVLACCRVISEGIAQVPLKLKQEKSDGTKIDAKEHPLYTMLWRRPNDWQTSFEWRETMQLHACLARGGFSYINRSPVTGRPLELIPLLPEKVKPVQRPDWGVVYELTLGDSGDKRTVPRTEIFHVRGPSWDGVTGLAILEKARDTIGLAIAHEDSMSRLHSNGARPSGVLTAPAKLDKDALKRIKESFQEAYAGQANAHKTIVLDGGMKYERTSLSPSETQSTEARRLQTEHICRTFRVFPQMIGYADKTATYASAEAFFIAHVVHTLTPWFERWEQALSRDLLTEPDLAAGLFPKFVVAGLMRGDAKSRAEFYASGIVNGWLTRNEARKTEDLDPIDGLDKPLMPLNMTDGSTAAIPTDPAQLKALARSIAVELGRPDLEEKIGRALSARNEGKLKQARDLLDEVLAEVDAKEE